MKLKGVAHAPTEDDLILPDPRELEGLSTSYKIKDDKKLPPFEPPPKHKPNAVRSPDPLVLDRPWRKKGLFYEETFYSTQAGRVYRAFGGVRALCRCLKRIGIKRNPSSVARWNHDKEMGGSGGIIPSRMWPYIYKAGRIEGIQITPEMTDPSSYEEKIKIQTHEIRGDGSLREIENAAQKIRLIEERMRVERKAKKKWLDRMDEEYGEDIFG